MKTLLAFGDSNTWGLIPGTHPLTRFPYEKRWTGILQDKLEDDIRIVEEGLCGRTTVFEDSLRPGRRGLASLPQILESHAPIDAVTIMLGTNDCKSFYGASAHTIGKGVELCLDEILKYISPSKVLLMSPIHLGEEVWHQDKDPEFDRRSVEVSRELKEVYKKIADRKGVSFLAASDIVKASPVDDEHLDEDGHKIFAEAVYSKIREII